MRSITADLITVQATRSPQARASCTVEQRGLTPTPSGAATPWIWEELVSNAGQSSNWRVTAAVTLSDGITILRFKETGTKVQVQRIDDPTDPAEWTGNAWSDLLAHGADGLAALWVDANNAVILWYINSSNGNVYGIWTTDDGDSWAGPVTLYSGGDAVADLVVALPPNTPAANITTVGFTTYAGGNYTAKFASYYGAAWTVEAYGTTGWRVSGIDSHNDQPGQSTVTALIHRAQDLGPSRLRKLDWTPGSGFANPVDLDMTQAGLFGLAVANWRFFDLNIEQSITLGTTIEMGDGSGTYNGISGLLYSEELLADEPIMFPDLRSANDRGYTCLVESGGKLYHLGDTYVAEATEQQASTATLIPIRYEYSNHRILFEFEAGIDTLYVGQILKLTRTLAHGTTTGNESIRFYISRIDVGLDVVRVLGLDAVGLLGVARCRRPSILNDGTAAGLAQVMRRLAARYGVPATSDDSGLESASVMPLTLQPAESLLGAAYRVTSQSAAYLVPANDGSFGVTVITPGDSDVSGDYDDTPYVYPMGEAPIHTAQTISDYTRLAFSYILGTKSTDPEDGSAVGMAAGPRIDNTRPISLSLTNQRYNTETRVEAAASAEATRQTTLPMTAVLESNANLALERYDVIAVTLAELSWSSTQFRIRNIVERWDRNRLTQELELGDV